LCAISLLLDRFEKEDRLFAKQCIWRLASIIQFTDILIYYWHYRIFRSDYGKNLVVMPLRNRLPSEEMIPESNILELHSAMDIITTPFERRYIDHPSRKKFLPKESSNNSSINRTQTDKVFKPERLKQKDLRK